MDLACSLGECSVALTGKCLKSHSPVESCPNVASEEQGEALSSESGDSIDLSATRPVYPGYELGIEQASAIMAARYTFLIGVLGDTDAGKTSLLCSLYLLTSCGGLAPQHRFAGSKTLLGYESRLRLYRSWDGPGLPERITPHTELAHPRMPGFLHIALSSRSRIPPVSDLLFTDLPGEWTSGLIKTVRSAERWHFLQRADGLVLTFRADELSANNTRHSQLQTGRVLLQRLRDTVGVQMHAPLVVSVTRCDLTDGLIPPTAYEIAATANEMGFSNVATLGICSFSTNTKVPSGFGLGDLLTILLPDDDVKSKALQRTRGDRTFQLYEWRENA